MTGSGRATSTLAALAALAVAASTASAAGRFTTRIDNPWFPLRPGTTFVYKGVDNGAPSRDVFAVTHHTRVIDGVRCVVIDDRLYAGKRLIERTRDYYVQDRGGTVWYFGEDTAELDAKGHVRSREGTWHAGTNGAKAGIYMPAHPKVGEHHRQEYDKGNAEDHFRVQSLTASISVPYGSYDHVLSTRETSPLEPGLVDGKYYVKGIGQVLEMAVRGPKERGALVSIRRGG